MTRTNGSDSRQSSPAAQKKIELDRAAVMNVDLNFREHDCGNLRLTRLSMLKHAIAAGTYGVPSAAVAEKMVDRMLRESKTMPFHGRSDKGIGDF